MPVLVKEFSIITDGCEKYFRSRAGIAKALHFCKAFTLFIRPRRCTRQAREEAECKRTLLGHVPRPRRSSIVGIGSNDIQATSESASQRSLLSSVKFPAPQARTALRCFLRSI